MASIHRDPRSPKGVWYCHFVRADGTRAVRSTGKRNRAEAKILCEAFQAAEEELSRGELTRVRIETLVNESLSRLGFSPVFRPLAGPWCDEWLAGKVNIAPGTLQLYRQAVALFKGFLGERGLYRPLESITEKDIRAFIDHLASEGRAPKTVFNIRRCLSVAFQKALKRGLIQFNPVAAVELPPARSATRGTFSPEQVAKLIAVAGLGSDWAGAILFGYGTGARLMDVVTLRWASLDLENGVCFFRQRKTGKETMIGLHTDSLDWVLDRSAPESPDAYVFPTLALLPKARLSEAFSRLIDSAGIPNPLIRERNSGKGRSLKALGFHSFRHGAATAVFNAAALKEITRRVTHHTAGGVVDRYIHEDLEAIKAATQLIPRLPKTQ